MFIGASSQLLVRNLSPNIFGMDEKTKAAPIKYLKYITKIFVHLFCLYEAIKFVIALLFVRSVKIADNEEGIKEVLKRRD